MTSTIAYVIIIDMDLITPKQIISGKDHTGYLSQRVLVSSVVKLIVNFMKRQKWVEPNERSLQEIAGTYQWH